MMIQTRLPAPRFPAPRACCAEAEAKTEDVPFISLKDGLMMSTSLGRIPTETLARIGLFVGGNECFAACPIHSGYWCESTLAAHGIKHRCAMGHTWGLGE